ncbi:MAG: archaeosortase/exosortase family protein [Verrucomicrobiota bacterium]
MAFRKQLANSFREKAQQSEFWIHSTIFALLALAFWPVTQWFATTTHDQSRLFHSLVVLALATILLVRFGGVEIRDTFTLNPSARRALIASFVLLAIQAVSRKICPNEWQGWVSLIAIPAYCCGLAALVRFICGEGTRRLTRTAAGTFCAFLLLSILMQPLDWPLRGYAGEWSAAALGWIGKSVELGLVGYAGGPPKLILLVDQYPFHVASECNGFGVILTSLLLALLLAIYRRLGLLNMALNIFAGLIIGFAFNILRIVIIVLLAPSFMEQYMLMHEIVGGITYWSCLVLVWIALKGPTRDEASAKA